MAGELVWGYNKWFKDLLSYILYPIDKELLIQWFVVGLLQREPLWMHKIQSCEDALEKEK